jgi:hypothetical protein
MALPFNNSNERKYCCFVCGKSYTVYDEYNEHIKSVHEELKDYVQCPICSACVRCVRSHCKVKHGKDKNIKFNGPSKALVWRDQHNNFKKEKKVRFREGYMFSQKNQKEMHYRSGWECQVYEILEGLTDVVKYDVEPFKCPYLFEGVSHIYNPDLSVLFSDGHIEVWEIKPGSQTDLPINHAKWLSCDSLCKNRGWQFVVMTEKGIGKLKMKLKIQQNTQ